MTKRITIKGNVKIIESDNKKYVLKPKDKNIKEIFNYLSSRNFNYYPNYYNDEIYDIYDYLEDSNEPPEQKIEDLISLISLLHYKTTYYGQVDVDDFKYRYEDLKSKLSMVKKYYNDLNEKINNEIYMSPSSYFIARNISIIYTSINYCYKNIELWYEMVKDKKKVRYVTNHNNLSLDHFLVSDKPYLISWNHHKIDLPIVDLIVLYKNHYHDFDFYTLFNRYEQKYPLLEEEKILLFIYIVMPAIVNKTTNEYEMCTRFATLIEYQTISLDLATKYRVKKQTNKE